MSLSHKLAFLFLLFLSSKLPAQDMLAKDCGTCHETQFKSWIQAKHNTRGVVCGACHGEFHSGTLNACTSCHTGEHDLEYKQWQFVRDYIVEGDTSDYYCIVCHDPHNPKKEKVLLCNGCHGATVNEIQPRKGFRANVQKAHNVFARVAPEMDQGWWNKGIKSRSGKLMLGAGVLIIGGILIFPYVFTGYVFCRWLAKKFSKSKARNEKSAK